MLLRQTPEGVLAITQPRHAWLAGELARAWGAPGFAVPEPRDVLLCAIALHDIGWLDWDCAPRFDPRTGYPLPFADVPATIHTALWSRGVEMASLYGDLPALHISRHGIAIYERTFDAATARPQQAAAVKAFRQAQTTLQERLADRIATDPALAPWLTAAHLDMTKRFIVAIDTMSLNLCWGISDVVTLDDVPTSAGATRMALSRRSDREIAVSPWPFVGETVTVHIEGKRIRAARDQHDLDVMFRDRTPCSKA